MTKDVRSIAEDLCRLYDTRDPFEIARARGILIVFEPLGSIRGYYNVFLRTKFIHINEGLDQMERMKVCAHELGHAVLHTTSNKIFLRDHTYISVNKMEWEANCFMAMLVYSDDELMELIGCSFLRLEKILGIPEDLIRWRYEQIA